jgi:DNA-binding transcriptional ArsR family regulator
MPLTRQQPSALGSALLKALAHPIRFRIMIVLTEREATPKELSEILDEDLKLVCKHIKLLERDGYVELVDTDRRRGGTQHIYRATARPFVSTEETEALPMERRQEISAAISQAMIMDLVSATQAGTMDSSVDRVLLRTPLRVDGEGFKELDKLYCETQAQIHLIEARCEGRAADGGEPLVTATTALASFEVPEHPK